jgi:5'-AMP-activated protein kinase, regulatory beta subunit
MSIPAVSRYGQSSEPTNVPELLEPVSPGYPHSLTDRVRAIMGSHSEHPTQPDGDDMSSRQYKTVFSWVYEGTQVFVSTSVDQFRTMVPLSPIPDSSGYAVIVLMPAGEHEFKFLVDNQWTYDPNAPMTTRHGNDRVNIVHVRGVEERPELQQPVAVPEPADTLAASDDDADVDDVGYQDDDSDSDGGQAYGHTIPPSEVYCEDPPTIPPQFGEVLLNNRIKQVDPYLLPVPGHVTVNHLYMHSRTNINEEVAVLGITQRHKTKFITTVYWAPIQTHHNDIDRYRV